MTSSASGNIGDGATREQLNLLPKEIARRGWHVMIPGDVYHATCELLDKLLTDGQGDPAAQTFLEQLRSALISEAKPYAPKAGSKEPSRIQVVQGLPPGIR